MKNFYFFLLVALALMFTLNDCNTLAENHTGKTNYNSNVKSTKALKKKTKTNVAQSKALKSDSSRYFIIIGKKKKEAEWPHKLDQDERIYIMK